MKITKVKGIYFSPTDTTKEITTFMTKKMAENLNVPFELISYTLPEERKQTFDFAADELIIWGTPVYAGRIPNKTLSFVKEALHGHDTPMIPVAVYGNRSVDNGLSELTGSMKDQGGIPVAGAAVVARHSFSTVLAKGRPDEQDYMKLQEFCDEAAEKLVKTDNLADIHLVVCGKEHPQAYYVPKKEDGTPAKFLKAKPLVDETKCTTCGICGQVCPMGSYTVDNMKKPSCTGICIKCQACVRKCPEHAIYFDDEAFLSHVRMVEKNFPQRKEPQFFHIH